MRKHKHFFLTIGGTLLLTGVVVTTLTTTILTSQKNKHWGINPFQNYNFQQAEASLLKADVPTDLVGQYLTLSKKITGVIKTDKVIKSSELLTLDDAIINSISQQMIWNQQSSEQVQYKIDLVKPILMQFYEYYDQVYVPEHHLETDTLNAMQLESSNTDLYKWSIGTNLRDYGLIRNYLTSAREAWISKMSLAYILKTFLNKKIVHYNSLNQEVTDGIGAINQEIKELLNDKSVLLNDKISAQNQIIPISTLLSSINNWKRLLIIYFSSTMATSATQVFWEFIFKPVAWALIPVLYLLNKKYASVEEQANNDLNLQVGYIQETLRSLRNWNSRLKPLVTTAFNNILQQYFNATKRVATFLSDILGAIMSFVGMGLLTADFVEEKNMFDNFAKEIANPDSVTSNAINVYVDDLDNQMSNISSTITSLNLKEDNYMQQKSTFNIKLKELVDSQSFFRSFDAMNEETFTQTNFFTLSQIQNWQKEAENKYGYLTEASATTSDFLTAFTNEKNNFNNKYQIIQKNEEIFFNNYNIP